MEIASRCKSSLHSISFRLEIIRGVGIEALTVNVPTALFVVTDENVMPLANCCSTRRFVSVVSVTFRSYGHRRI